MGYLITVGIGLVGGVCIGYMLGANSPRRCGDCRVNPVWRYRAGYGAGWQEAVVRMTAALKKHAVEAKNTWTITKSELERVERDMLDVGKSNQQGAAG